MDHADILIEFAQRPLQVAEAVLRDISTDVLNQLPDGVHNSVSWLIWHAARQQDLQVADLDGHEQVWTAQGWADRFGLDLPVDAFGFGASADQVAVVQVESASLLRDYLAAVVDRLVGYVRGLSSVELDEVIDASWDPPVTRGVRLVSTIDDCVQHLGQAAYVRGLLQRWTIGY
jgi:hypothetical protein